MRAALIQTANAYRAMPERPEDLPSLAPKLEAVRRANVAENVALIAEAKGMGASLACLGRGFAVPEGPWPPPPEEATLAELRRAAYENAMVVVAPLAEPAAFDERGLALEGPLFRSSAGALSVGLEPGARLVFLPAAVTGDVNRWQEEACALAAAKGVFVGALNRLGAEKPSGVEYRGGSFFAGPDGRRLPNLSQHPNVIVSELGAL